MNLIIQFNKISIENSKNLCVKILLNILSLISNCWRFLIRVEEDFMKTIQRSEFSAVTNLIHYVCIFLFSVYRGSIRTARLKCNWALSQLSTDELQRKEFFWQGSIITSCTYFYKMKSMGLFKLTDSWSLKCVLNHYPMITFKKNK